jgi:hypothetical protein
MKNLLFVLVALALAFLLLRLGIFALHDAQTFVPPPDSVTQSFFKMLELKRFSIAQKFLTEQARQKVEDNELSMLNQKILAKIGPYQVYGGEFQIMDQDQATSNAHLKGTFVPLWPVVKLQREKGEWKIREIVIP